MHRLLMIFLLAWPSIAAAECTSLSVASWLLGNWVASAGAGKVHERWQRLGPRTFEGQGLNESPEGVVAESETLRLVEMSSEVFYIAKVSHNAVPIAFKLEDCSDEMLVFTNPAHDFPRRIEYRRNALGGFSVVVSDGGERGFELTFSEHRDAE